MIQIIILVAIFLVIAFFILVRIAQNRMKKMPMVEDHAKILTLTDKNFNNLLKNKVVLVDFWASWCGPCMKSLPELKAFYDKYKGDKLEILGVSLDDDENAWKSTVEKQQLKWKHISDLKGWKCEGAKLYAVNAIPATVFIDSKGVILGRNLTIGQMELIILKTTK